MDIRIPRSWLTAAVISGLVTLVAKELALELIFGSAADWLKSNLWILGDFLAWRWSGLALGLILLVGVWVLGIVIQRQQAAPAGGGHATTNAEAATAADAVLGEKGILDFKLDAIRSAKDYGATLAGITKETVNIGKKLRSHTKRIQAATGDAEKEYKAAFNAASDLDAYSEFIENNLPRLQQTADLLGESYIGYIERLTPTTQFDKSQLAELREVIGRFLDATTSSRTSTAGFRDSVSRLRRIGISRGINRACERLVTALEGVITTMEGIEGSCRRLLDLIDDKTAQPETPQGAPSGAAEGANRQVRTKEYVEVTPEDDRMISNGVLWEWDTYFDRGKGGMDGPFCPKDAVRLKYQPPVKLPPPASVLPLGEEREPTPFDTPKALDTPLHGPFSPST